jgi:high frequency lysogenization protein
MTLLGYARDVFYLQKKLQGNKAMMDKVGAGISKASQQAQHFSPTHANVLANIADLYQQTISTFNRRIQVKGSPDSLQQQAIANKIRALLFAAIRCAVLWQQVGGRKTHLVFGGAKIMDIAQQLKRQL